jgi:hypothetical protein
VALKFEAKNFKFFLDAKIERAYMRFIDGGPHGTAETERGPRDGRPTGFMSEASDAVHAL